MTLKEFLKEEFGAYASDYRGKSFPIFKFPLTAKEKKELMDLSKTFRFIAVLKTKTVYVFSSDLTHVQASEALKLEYSLDKPEETKSIAIFGEADRNFTMTDSYNVNEIKYRNKELFNKYKESNWKFARGYIESIDEFLFKK